MKLYHTGFEIIKEPDIHFGRKNADFSQGFYLSDNRDFSVRWARERKGKSTFINEYELECEGLKIKRFERNAEWFSYGYEESNLLVSHLPFSANSSVFSLLGVSQAASNTKQLSQKNQSERCFAVFVSLFFIQIRQKTKEC